MYLCIEFELADRMDKIQFGLMPCGNTSFFIILFVSFIPWHTGQSRTHKLVQCLFCGNLAGTQEVDEYVRELLSVISDINLLIKKKIT